MPKVYIMLYYLYFDYMYQGAPTILFGSTHFSCSLFTDVCEQATSDVDSDAQKGGGEGMSFFLHKRGVPQKEYIFGPLGLLVFQP